MLKDLFETATKATVGGKFRDICVVGLNRVEFLPGGTETPIFGDRWQDVTDEQTRRRMALIFFAPRELDGEPLDPNLFLTDDPDDPEAVALTQQAMGNMPLLDFCRMPPAEAGTVHIVVAADIIFHWDLKDNYIMPTNKFSWVRDVQSIVKGYPKATQFHIYTNWENEQAVDLDIPVKPLRTLPLEQETWVNVPTFQEKNGLAILIAALLLVALVWGGLSLQSRSIDSLGEQIRITQQRIPREGRFVELSRFMLEQEKFMQYRSLLPYLALDIGHAIEDSGMKIENFELQNPTPLEPNPFMVATIEAQRDVYKGWLQEEPIAKDVLVHSTSLVAVRKPPGNLFKLEGLIHLPHANTLLKDAQQGLAKQDAPATQPASPTTPEGPTS
jgi:hypothetical protein